MAKNKTTLQISFGALCPPILGQLKDAGINVNKEDVDRWQRCADSIVRLAVHQILSDSEVHKARQRLLKKITRELAAAYMPKRPDTATASAQQHDS